MSPGANVGLDHDTSYGAFSGAQLRSDGGNDFGLVVVVLLRVAVYVVANVSDACTWDEGRYARLQSTMMDGWKFGLFFLIAAAAA